MPCVLRRALLGAFLLPQLLRAQVFDSPRGAYDYAQGQRQAARARWTRTDPAEIRAGIELLTATLQYLADPRVVALGRRYESLRWRAHDVYLDLAVARSKLGDAPGVVEAIHGILTQHRTLESMPHLASWAAELLEEAQVPASTKGDARVLAALAELRGIDPFHPLRPSAFGSTPGGELSEDQRIAGLALFWSEARYNFVYFDRLGGLDWHRAFLEFLPRVRAAKDTLGYYRVLQEFCALLKDAHTTVSLPRELQLQHEAAPPLSLTLAAGRVFVRRAASPKLRALGLLPGVEITAVAGQPPRAYAQARFGPRICASTPQDREVRLLCHQLLRGEPDQPLALTVLDREGKEHLLSVPRTGYDDREELPPYELTIRDDRIACLALRSCEDEAVVRQFAADLPRVLACDALVLDIRDNSGGSSNVGYGILAALTDREFATSSWSTPLYRPAFRAWGRRMEWHQGKAGSAEPRAGERFCKPVALLIGPRTFSAAEDLAVAFDTMRRGPLVGEATGGSTGQPLSFPLPGGGSARVCAKRDTYPDGKAFVGVGVQPTHPVAPRPEDLRAGRDTVLEAALELLREESRRAGK